MKTKSGYLTILILILSLQICEAQKNWQYNGQVNFGCNLFLTRGHAQKFPGIRFFGAFIATAIHGDLIASYGPSLSIYTKTIGANLNPLVGDWQVDFTNSFAVGLQWGEREDYYKFSRTIHNGDFYNLVSARNGLAMVGTNFIVNSHKRNQIVGSINATFGNVSINYYNDGPPFDFLGLSDNFDRYWTGGFAVLVHSKKGYNTVEFSFDQFTGYIPLLYELTGKLGLNIPLYDRPDKKGINNFNTSAYSLKVNFDQRFGINAGVIGSLKFGNRYYGLQEIIHILGKYPMHPNNDDNRFFFGGNYNQFHNVKL
ncbi:MAG: hypothetical protein H7122_15485 [Chitinophagaceae bacterium]|nr:hypothetical protein [Chitinophagaceae bacterium]